MKWLMKLGLKFVSYETLVGVIASAIAYIMEYARKKSSPEGWERAKKSVKAIKTWVNLFDEVYEDDTLTDEEEKLIEEAISGCTAVDSIYKLLKNKKAPKKGSAKKGSTKKGATKKISTKKVTKK